MIPKRNPDLDRYTTGALPDIIKAAYAGDCTTVLSLLRSGENINTIDTRDSLTPLHIACMQGDLALVELILDWDKLNGDVDFTLKSKYRPRLAWQMAMNAHHYEIADLVDDRGLARKKTPGAATTPKP